MTTKKHDIDWSRALFPQVGLLGSHYNSWLRHPVTSQMLVFPQPIIESLSHTRWQAVALVWLTVAAYLIYTGYSIIQLTIHIKLLLLCVLVCVGMCAWTLLEYIIHRCIFHSSPGSSPLLISLHFILHGIHHKVPFDSGRLVMPIPVACVTYMLLYSLLALTLAPATMYCVLAGITLGYVRYDLTHYYLHNAHPQKGTHLYRLKRRHIYHHFSNHSKCYGVSTSFWDHVFGTEI